MKSRFREKKVAGFILIGIAAFSLFSLIVMSLWNVVLVPVIHVSTVSFWQAAGILLLSKILFSGFKGGGSFGRGRHQWNQEMKDKWQNMTPEEKEKMKQEWRQRCSGWGRRQYTENDLPTANQKNPSDIS
jgi:Ca2+/H+ antiporter, TMEM165/GDT1 family